MSETNPPDKAKRKSPRQPAAPEALKEGRTGARVPANPSLPSEQSPSHIGRFEVRKLLGDDAFTRAYLGFDPELEREVAIKVLKVDELTPEFRETFLRENQLAALIHHPNICPIYEVGTDDGLPYIVMRKVPKTLAGLLKRLHASMPPRNALAITRKLALGLVAAHAQKVIHRDLKPANVLYDEANREVLIADFGLARFADRGSEASNEVPEGTRAYMAPEQTRGQAAEVGPLADVYSLGVLLYEMLAGRVPFTGSAEEVMRDHRETPPPLPSSVRPGLDPRLDTLVLRAMAKHPTERYSSAKAFARAIADYLRGGEQLSSPARLQAGSTGQVDATEAIKALDPDTEPSVPSPKSPELTKPDKGRPSKSSRPLPGRKPVPSLPAGTSPTPPAETPPSPTSTEPTKPSRRPVWLVIGLVAFIGLVAGSITVALSLLNRQPAETTQQPPATEPPAEQREKEKPKLPKPTEPRPHEPKKIDPKLAEPKPKDPEPKPKEPEPKPKEPEPGLGDPVAPPNNDRPRAIAQIKTNRSLVVTQPPDGGEWVRLKLKAEDDESVMSNWSVMALPGYKADVSVDKKVLVRLWGNVPEQLPYRVLEARVKFHIPPAGFDADITLLGGRIYLKSEKPGGAKVRLRLGPEVWDVTLPDTDTDVLAELISWFEPDTVFARKGGSKPRLEGRVAVVFGTAAFAAPVRVKKIDKLPRGNQVTWDSVTNKLNDAKLIELEDREALLFRDVSDPAKGELYKQVTRLLTSAADKVTTRDSIQAVITELVGPDLPDVPQADRDLVSRLAVYAQVALADCTADGVTRLKPLIEVLRAKPPWLTRQAVVTALVNWVARDVENTALLHPVLVEKGLTKEDADWLLILLRGYISPTKPNPARLDALVEPLEQRDRSLLGDPEVALREAALWNLMVVKLESWVPLPLGVNVGAVGAKVDSDEYKKFLKDMKAEVEALKKRPPPPKMP